ncbi:hypothetical protein ACWFRM_43230 [Streptomyces sp. NPDC055144]
MRDEAGGEAEDGFVDVVASPLESLYEGEHRRARWSAGVKAFGAGLSGAP